jgi:hypothetical protein
MVNAGEQALIEQLVRDNIDSAKATPGPARRGQHPKHHGCVRATFAVNEQAPRDLRVGIFAQPQQFEALIRFSNGRRSDDRKADAHGMAIKLLNIPGRKLIPGRESETTHDFILVDSETFFSGDLAEYLDFARGVQKIRRNLLYATVVFPRMLLFHTALLKRVRRFISHRPTSPLTSWYFSSVPYRLGDRFVKYVVRPGSTFSEHARVSEPDGLSKALRDHLRTTEAVFDFGVDVQTNSTTQPIEDPTVSWSAQDGARREWLASITIPQQDIGTNSSLAENIAFSPWHALPEHEPVGAINRARMPVYREMAKLRHESNGVVPTDTSEPPSH